MQMARPARWYVRCRAHLESLPADDERATTWLTDLRAYSRRFGRGGQLAVGAAIDSVVNSEYDFSESRRSWSGRVWGAADAWTVSTPPTCTPPHPAESPTASRTWLPTVAAVGAWLDTLVRTPLPSPPGSAVSPDPDTVDHPLWAPDSEAAAGDRLQPAGGFRTGLPATPRGPGR